jgi:hypothetical protein
MPNENKIAQCMLQLRSRQIVAEVPCTLTDRAMQELTYAHTTNRHCDNYDKQAGMKINESTTIL